MPACEKPGKKEAMKDLDNALSEAREDALEELNSGGLGVEKPIDNSKLDDALDSAQKASSGQDKIAFELARYSIKRMEQLMEPLTAASGDLFAALDYSGVESKADLAALSENVRKYEKINAEVKAMLGEGFIDEIKKQADVLGLKGKTRKDFFTGFEPSMRRQFPLLREVRDQDSELCRIILDQHELLTESFGEWALGEEGLVFESGEVAESYNELFAQLQKVAAAQEETQRKALNTK